MMNTRDIEAIRDDIRAMLREHTGPAVAKLANLRVHAEDREINPALIDAAESWLNTFRQECGDTWRDPQRVLYDDYDVTGREIEFSWYGERNISVSITLEGATFDKFDFDDDDGYANTPEERAALWRWLNESEQSA